MIGLWADYSGGRPSGLALRQAGFIGVIRYIGLGTPGKRITAPEYRDLTANGLQVLTVAESTTNRANAGYDAGIADAHTAENDRIALGLPSNMVIYAANDQPTYTSACVDYVRGFRDVLGVGRTGAYGFGDFLASVHNGGLSAQYWQAGHPPNMTNTSSFVHFWQRQGTLGNGTSGPATPTTILVNGVTCDINNQLLPLPGQQHMTTLDDKFQSEYTFPDGTRSTVILDYAAVIRQLDARTWYYNNVLTGEQRFTMPDNVRRNMIEILIDLTQRLITLDGEIKSLTNLVGAEQVALLHAIQGIPTGVTVDAAAVAAALTGAGLPAAVADSLAHLLAQRIGTATP